jgi:hypothetical protein
VRLADEAPSFDRVVNSAASQLKVDRLPIGIPGYTGLKINHWTARYVSSADSGTEQLSSAVSLLSCAPAGTAAHNFDQLFAIATNFRFG